MTLLDTIFYSDLCYSFHFMSNSQHEHRDGSTKDKKNKKHKKDKDSDAEDDANVILLEPEKIENIKENETGTIVTPPVGVSDDANVDEDQNETQNDQNSKKYDLISVFFKCFLILLFMINIPC